jgi:PKD repeat protein
MRKLLSMPAHRGLAGRFAVVSFLLTALLVLPGASVGSNRTTTAPGGTDPIVADPAPKPHHSPAALDTSISLYRSAAPNASADPEPVGSWTTYEAAADRSGHNDGETTLAPGDAAKLEVLWNVSFPGPLFASPSVVNGTVYEGSWDGNETALYASNGTVQWNRFLGIENFTGQFYGCPWANPIGVTSAATVVGATLFVGSATSYFGLNATTGAKLWTYSEGAADAGYYAWSSPLVDGGNVYVGISSQCDNPLVDGGLLELNATTGKLVHHLDTGESGQGGSIWSSPTLDAARRTIWVTTGNGPYDPASGGYGQAMVAVNASTLSVIGSWQVPAGPNDIDFGAGGTLFNDSTGRLGVVATNKDGWAYALNRSDPSAGPIWSDQLTTFPGAAGCQPPGQSIAPGTYDGSSIYLGSSYTKILGASVNGSVRSVDPSNGSDRWQTPTNGSVLGGLASANGLVVDVSRLLPYTGSSGGCYSFSGANRSWLQVLNASTGTPLYTYFAPYVFSVAPSIADGRIFVATGTADESEWTAVPDHEGHLYAFGVPLAGNVSIQYSRAGPNASQETARLQANVTGGMPGYSCQWSTGGVLLGSACGLTVHSSVGAIALNLSVRDSAGDQWNSTTGVLSWGLSAISMTAEPLAIPLGGSVVLEVNASGGDLPYTYAYSMLPPGCHPANVSRLPCAPTAAGTYSPRVNVSDTAGDSFSAGTTVTVRVFPPPAGPRLTGFSIQPSGAVVGQSIRLQGNASGGVLPWNESLVDLPPGCYSAGSVNLTCAPSAPGNFTVEAIVQDSLGRAAFSNASIEIVPPLSIASFTVSPARVALGTPISMALTFDGGAPPYAVQYVGLPTGCPPTNRTMFSCTPEDPGSYNVTVEVTAGIGVPSIAWVDFSVYSSSPGTSSGPPGGPPDWAWELPIAAFGSAIVAVLLVLGWRRRPRGGWSKRMQDFPERMSGSVRAPAPRKIVRTPIPVILGIIGVFLLSAAAAPVSHLRSVPPAPATITGNAGGLPRTLTEAARSVASGHGPARGSLGVCTLGLGDAAQCQGAPAKVAPPGTVPASPNVNSTVHWVSLSPKAAPTPRWAMSMVWDAADGYVLGYGGTNGGSPFNDTWKYANRNWTPLTTTGNSPAGGSGGGQNMVYDPIDRVVVLLYAVMSSSGGAGIYTWTYHAGAWKNISKAGAPPAVWRESFAWDAADRYAVMFGGCPTNSCYTLSNATWSYVGGNWTNRTATVGPPQLTRAAMQFDPADDFLILFDGYLTSGTANNQTWEYLAGTWTLLSPTGTPTARDGALIGSFGSHGGVYIFGGEIGNYGGALGNDTWYFLNDNWTRLNTTRAPPRSGITMMAWDAPNSSLLYFGGYNGAGTNDTWELSEGFGADVQFTPAGTDVGHPMAFNATAFGGTRTNYTFLWDFGDGSNSTSANTTHSYATSGVYTVSLTVQDSGGETNEENYTVPVAKLPMATATASDHGADVGVPVHFRDVVVNGTSPFTYAWDFGDGHNATGAVSTHAFNSTGSFNVSSAATDAVGAVAYSNLTIATNTSEVTVAAANRTALDAGQAVQFNATPLHGTAPYNFSWVFGDRAKAYGRSVDHTYAAVGTFPVKVWTNDSAGDTTIANLSINVHPHPVLTANASVTTVDSGLPVHFYGHPGSGTAPYSLNWSFGDGTFASGQNVTHAYPGHGSYTVYANLTDQTGGTARAQVALTVNPVLHVGLSADPPYGVPAAATHFVAAVSGGTTPYVYLWEFGDGTNGSGFTGTTDHVYSRPGLYNASVNVTDGTIVTVRSTYMVEVVVPLVAGVNESTSQVTAGQSVSLQATPSHGLAPYSFIWTHLPTGCTSENLSVLPCNPTGAGYSAVTVTVRDAVGESASASKNLNVVSAILASASASASIASSCKGPYTVNLTSTVAGGAGPYSYSWNFGDGSPASAAANPSHAYSGSPGTYPVGLTVQDADNATKFVSVNAVVAPSNCSAGSTASLGGWALWAIGLGIGLAVVALAALAFVLRNRRPPSDPPEEEPPLVHGEVVEPGTYWSSEPPAGNG